MRTTRALPGLALLALAACRSASPPASGNDRGEDAPAPAAVVGGRPIGRPELCDFWYERYRESYRRALDDLVDERLAREAAAAEGVVVPPEVLDRAVAAEAAAREAQLREAYGEAADLAGAVRRAYGEDVEGWKRRVLRPRLEAQHLVARVARLDSRRRPEVRAKVIVTDDPEKASRLRAKLAAGADFSLTALKESLDPTAKVGGDLPPIARGETSLPGVEEHLFAAPEGSLVGPLRIRTEAGPRWHVYRVVRRREAWTEAGPALLARLERDLVDSPPEAWEVARWRERARRAADVHLFAPDGRALDPSWR